MFDLPPQEASEHSRIVVVALGSASVGIVMDNVNEVPRCRLVDAMPGLLIREGGVG